MSASRIVAVAAVAAIGCGGTATRVRRPGQEHLAAIRIDGNNAITDSTLISGLALRRNLKAGRSIDEYQLSVDLTRIAGAYQKLGYFNVEVTSTIEKKGDDQTLVFKVVEGPRAIAYVEIVGLPPEVPAAKARALVELADGAVFDYKAFDAAKAPMLALVENAGYAHAELHGAVLADRKTAHAVLRYEVDTGPFTRFGPIEISGVDGDLAEAARKRVDFKEGDAYSTAKLAAAQQAIYGIQRFSTVRMDVDRGNLAEVVPIKISLVESTRNEARAGGGLGFDALTYNLRVRGLLSHAGWITPLTTTSVEGQLAYAVLRDNCDFFEVWACEYKPRGRLIGTVSQQDLLRRDVTGEVQGGLDYLAYEPFTTWGARFRLGIGMPLGTPRVQGRLGWQLAGYYFTDIDPAIDAAKAHELGIDHFERLGAYTEAIIVDLRDNQVDPKRGGYGELRLAQGNEFSGSAYDYVQITPDLRGYISVFDVVIAARARLGAIIGEVAPTERYFAGGASSQRGFPERRLSPTATSIDADGVQHTVVIGGAALFETGVELRRHIEPWGAPLGAVVFLDGGDVTEKPEDLDPGHLHWALGGGIRVYTPIGPIRFEVARRLNRLGAGEPCPNNAWNWVLGLGEAF